MNFFNSQEICCKILYILERTEKGPLNIVFKDLKTLKLLNNNKM